MTRQAIKACGNVYYEARKQAGITSREEASKSLYVEPETIGKWETDKCVPSPDSVLEMSRVYGDPLLINHYCTEKCPIGASCYQKLDNKELTMLTVQIIHSASQLKIAQNKLVEITRDGVIDESELNELDEILECFDAIEQIIQEFKICVKKELPGDQPMQLYQNFNHIISQK